jgi:hypothetical protein
VVQESVSRPPAYVEICEGLVVVNGFSRYANDYGTFILVVRQP